MRMAQRMIKTGLFPGGLSAKAYFERMHISYGSPEEVAARLASDRVLPLATDLILQFSPATPSLGRTLLAVIQHWTGPDHQLDRPEPSLGVLSVAI